jgi:hypothetical protein
MERKQLTSELLQQLKQQGYRSLIAKGSPEGEEGNFTQVLLASKQQAHNEETAEATWQVNIGDDSFLQDGKMNYVVEI